MVFSQRILGATVSHSPVTPCLFFFLPHASVSLEVLFPLPGMPFPNMPANKIPTPSLRPITSSTFVLTEALYLDQMMSSPAQWPFMPQELPPRTSGESTFVLI